MALYTNFGAGPIDTIDSSLLPQDNMQDQLQSNEIDINDRIMIEIMEKGNRFKKYCEL